MRRRSGLFSRRAMRATAWGLFAMVGILALLSSL